MYILFSPVILLLKKSMSAPKAKTLKASRALIIELSRRFKHASSWISIEGFDYFLTGLA